MDLAFCVTYCVREFVKKNIYIVGGKQFTNVKTSRVILDTKCNKKV